MKIIWLGRFANNPYFRKRVGQTQIIILVLPVQLKILIIQECLVTFKTNDYSKKKKRAQLYLIVQKCSVKGIIMLMITQIKNNTI